MKQAKTLALGSILGCSAVASALAQGTVIFENSASSGNIYIGSVSAANYVQAGTYTVALLWAAGTSAVPQASLTTIAIYGLATGGQTSTGFFTDPATITTGAATPGGAVAVFEVQAWTGAYTSYAEAVAGGAHIGQSPEFLNATGNPNPPATPPVQTTGWDGNIIMPNTSIVNPEPGTLALAGLGAAGIWFFRRANRQQR